MKNIVLIAAAPLSLLAACGPDGAGNSAAVNTAGPVPDEITVNGVVYVRADKSAPAPAPSPTTSGNSLFGSSPPPNSGSSMTSSGGGSVPPNTAPGSGVAADHGE